MGYIENIDIEILNLIKTYFQSPIFDYIFLYFTRIGDKGAVWISIAIVLLFKKENRKKGAMVLLVLLLGFLLGELILKPLIGRARPFIKYEEFTTIIEVNTRNSFPSGHTTSSFAAAGILFNRLEKFNWGFFVLAGGIAFSRLYYFLHYPSDIVGGIGLGLFCAWLVLKF